MLMQHVRSTARFFRDCVGGGAPLNWRPFPLMVLGLLALLTALWGGLVRLGWAWPVPLPTLIVAHGPLMVCGFLGTLIGVERAVALGALWPYAAPLLTAAGVVALLAGLPAAPLMALGSLGLVAVGAVIVHRQCGLATVTMALGALLWVGGNGLWLAGWPLAQVVPWWSGFLVLTIAGERLELSRVLRLSGLPQVLFVLAVSLWLAGLLLLLTVFAPGVRVTGVGMVALAWWLLHYDVARRTVRQTGFTRFIAVCVLSGSGWLGVGGALTWYFAGSVAGPYYDAMLHAVFVGFVLAMLFGHGPLVFPAILGRALTPYHPALYGPLVLLHASLLLRVLGDLLGWWPGRQWGGLFHALAVLFFLFILAGVLRRERSSLGRRDAPSTLGVLRPHRRHVAGRSMAAAEVRLPERRGARTVRPMALGCHPPHWAR